MPDDFMLNVEALSLLDVAADQERKRALRPGGGLWGNCPQQSVKNDAQRSRIGWKPAFALASVLVLIAASTALRERIVRAFPSVAAAYAAIGLPVNPAGLELRSVKSQILVDGSRKVLMIEGVIANIRHESKPVPSLALIVRGGDGLPKYSWTIAAPKPRLEPGETVAFHARLSSPPSDGVDVLVRFASAEEIEARGKSPSW